MFESINGDDLFAQILLMRSADPRPVLLTEGHTDSRALEPHLDLSEIVVIVGNGRSTVERALSLVAADDVERVVGIIDSDLDRFLRQAPIPPGAIRTHYHDLDADIYYSAGTLERVLLNLVGSKAFDGVGQVNRHEVMDRLAFAAEVIGRLRVRSHSSGWSLSLGDLPFNQFYGDTEPETNFEQAATIILKRSQGSPIAREALQAEIEACLSAERDRRLGRGHDLARSVAAASRRWWGAKLSSDLIEKTMRAAFGYAEFTSTHIYFELVETGKKWGCKIVAG